MKSNSPSYFISNLSKTKKRPNILNPLYSALHGPAANDQSMLYYIDKKLQKRVTVCNKVLKHCVNHNVLYLYHGRRYCSEMQNITNTGDNNLFDNIKDVSTVEYPKHE